MPDVLPSGYTTADVARRYRVGEDKVRGWMKHGELAALNTNSTKCARPRFVITADALAEFERRRSVAPAAKPRRRSRRADVVDYYPD
jgi:hypothetical protein